MRNKLKFLLMFIFLGLLFVTSSCNSVNTPDLSSVSFEDSTVFYDGEYHYIFVSNLPENTSVSYINNGQKEVGEYMVIAEVTSENDSVILTAKLNIVLHEFENITMDSLEVTFDGLPHNLTCNNVPEFADVTYSVKDVVDPGTYNVTATITALNYKTLTITKTLTIKAKEFSNIEFKDLEVTYDGKYHSVEINNLPEFITVNYSGNNKMEPGTYTVTATLTAIGYKTTYLSANLTIKALEFEGISFESEKITYDGYNHSIYVKDVPDFATITYTGNNKSNIGEYTVTAKITATGYKTLTLTAKMTIGKFFKDINLVDRTFIYDGTNQKIKVDLSSVPSYTEVSYYLDGKSVTELYVKDVGTYKVKVLLTNDEYKYEPAEFSCVVKVINQTIGTVDETKDAYQITSDLKYQDLINLIKGKNYTVTCVTGDDYFYPDKSEKHEVSSVTKYYVNNDEVFIHYYLMDKDSDYNYLPTSTVTHIKIVGNEALLAQFNEGLLSTYESYRMDSKYFDENYGIFFGLQAIAYLAEGENGKVVDGKQGGYTTTYGKVIFDELENTISMETRNHYYHAEWNHDEVVTYTISNIGNTKVDIIDDFDVRNVKYEIFTEGPIIIGGIRYYENTANISIDSQDLKYNSGKEIILEPIVNGKKITELSYEYYDKYYDLDLTDYTICVYFDKNGNYQGEYSELGILKHYNYLVSHFEDYGGTIKYYGEWE